MNDKKIFITGMGAVTPIGVGVPAFWSGLMSGVCGIDEIPDSENLPVTRAAQVRDFNAKAFLPVRLVQDLEPYMQYAYVSAEEAVQQSGLDVESDRVGIVMGTALSGIVSIGDTAAKYATVGKSASPKFLTKAMGNIAAAQFSITHKIKGPSLTVSTACSSGGDAISIASLLLRSGAADAMIVMAGEATICPTLIQSLTKTGALSKTGTCMPFDVDRNGFVIGEGGGALVLESEEHMLARGAAPLAELLGCANNADAYNPVSPDPEGCGAAACMKLALESAGLSPDDIDYINAHGTATHLGDTAETKAIHAIFGDRPVYVSSTKGQTGHMMGAGGVVEIIACIKAINEGVLPVSFGCASKDPECDLNIVTEENKAAGAHIAMSNAFGFGGQNSCIIVGAAERPRG
ncbi:MAG: beta-ketoacyl-[acyl-carrier-protein] synthase family protein [Oscillospiraceae bacterium]|nr:beta-ketoacyl-[acyl-carrier-protein] synthase family protein [Oscillospiraceae bacterium]